MSSTSQKLDDLIKVLDQAAEAAESLRTAIDAKDKVGIEMERGELAKSLLAVDQLAMIIYKELD